MAEPLEIKCPACVGGTVRNTDYCPPMNVPCPNCDGTGYEITDEGRALLEFLDRHYHVDLRIIKRG